MIRVSASKLPLLKKCAWWAKPGVPWLKQNRDVNSRLGQAVHKAAELYQIHQTEPDLVGIAAEYDIKLDQLSGHYDQIVSSALAKIVLSSQYCRPEIKYAYDIKTGLAREMPETDARNYSNRNATEICGTADVVLMTQDQACIYDYKTGNMYDDFNSEDSGQLDFFAAALGSLPNYRPESIVTGFVKVKVDSIGFSAGVVTNERIKEIKAWLAEAPSIVAQATPNPGDHCRVCDARLACPEFSAAIAKDLTLAQGDQHQLSTPEQVAHVIRRLPLLTKALSDLQVKIEAYVDKHGDVDLGDGKAYGKKMRSVEKLDLTPDALRELVTLHGQDVQEAVHVSITKASLTKALGKEDALEAVETLRDLGCVKRNSYTYYTTKGSP